MLFVYSYANVTMLLFFLYIKESEQKRADLGLTYLYLFLHTYRSKTIVTTFYISMEMFAVPLNLLKNTVWLEILRSSAKVIGNRTCANNLTLPIYRQLSQQN